MQQKNLLLKFAIICLLFSNNAFSQTYNSFYGNVVSNVSAANILADLNSYENLGVKSLGSTQLVNAENWITQRYSDLGYTDVVIQTFPYSQSGTSNNIIVTKTGTTYPNKYIILDAHYDTINGTGTNDNGSGTALLLEVARLLLNVETEYSIKLIHFSGEENGLIGSSYYVNNTVNTENLDIKLVFNIDQVGGTSGEPNNKIYCERDQSNPQSNNAESATITNILANCMELYSSLDTVISHAYASDYVPFENNGEIITGLYEYDESPYSHTSQDVLSNMDPDYLYEVTKGALGALLEFAIATTLSTPDFTTQQIDIYPNPSSTGIINLNIPEANTNNTSLTLYTILGKKVYSKNNLTSNEKLDFKNLQKGVYLATIEIGNKKITKKIVLN
ncbi:MAG: M28 family peptidase [Oceanihabitans sp.]